MRRTCPAGCGKQMKNLSGLSRHEPYCTAKNKNSAPGRRLNLEPTFNEQSTAIKTQGFQQNESTDWSFLPVRDSPGSKNDLPQTDNRRIAPSSSSTLKIVSYLEISGSEAGQTILKPANYECTKVNDAAVVAGREAQTKAIYHFDQDFRTNRDQYSPFRDEYDFNLARWLFQEQVTKGAIDRYFQISSLAQIQEDLSYRSGEELLNQLGRIPWAIQADSWVSETIVIGEESEDGIPEEYVVRYRDVLGAIQFLIGHPPFREDLTYAPVHQFDINDDRLYTEMHTGDWWWHIQEQLPVGATVIPLLLSSDKTLLTQHQGDTSVWPVYLTIGNLSNCVRRSQRRPGSVLLGFLPVVSSKRRATKFQVWHEAIGAIMEPIKQYTKSGLVIQCADSKYRECYPVIAAFKADYEEQVLITGIKSGKQCSICTVPPDQRENLCIPWPCRTHESTWEQIRLQRQKDIPKSDARWLYDYQNFAWTHPLVNIHQIMTIDILHQLLKGLLMHTMSWIEDLVQRTMPDHHGSKNRRLQSKRSGIARLDARFAAVPITGTLRIFRDFSAITQWTGTEQKAIIRQLVPVVTPLLKSKHPYALLFTRAVVDLVFLTQYRSHTDTTLQYIDNAVYRINAFKEGFRKKGSKYGEFATSQSRNFNFPKFHIISHYAEYIRLYGTADGFDTEHEEARHKYMVKQFYNRTNKRKNFEEQLLWHSDRRLKLLAMEDCLLYKRSDPQSTTIQQDQVGINNFSYGHVDLATTFGLSGIDRLNNWCPPLTLSIAIAEPTLLPALASFVREQRGVIDHCKRSDQEIDNYERDTLWLDECLVAVHTSVICWKRDRSATDGAMALVKDIVRCKPKWNGTDLWRRDSVIVQEEPSSGHSQEQTGLKNTGKLIGEVRVLISIKDPQRYDDKTGKCMIYRGAFIRLLKLQDGGIPNPFTGMVGLKPWNAGSAKNPRTLGSDRVYDIAMISRGAHVIPDNEGGYFLNNYLDWDSYNSIFDSDFLEAGEKMADEFTAFCQKTSQTSK